MSNVTNISEQTPDLVTKIPISTVIMECMIHDLIFPCEVDTPNKRGRPKGSKNKTKQIMEQVPTQPKKRGRPKGSKNKTKQIMEQVPTEPKKRGRPKGSKNKIKDLSDDIPTEPKKRGRPKGSKNKTQ